MKKNTFMRIASVLLVVTLLSTCAISGTFAKYVASDDSSDSARVAYWGWQPAEIVLTDLFATAYINDEMTSSADAIAPGTTNKDSFAFAYVDNTNANVTAPEVAYQFAVSVEDSAIGTNMKGNTNIQWALVTGDGADIAGDEWGSWDAMIADIKSLSGDATGTKIYGPGQLPDAFKDGNNVYTIAWRWVFYSTDAQDYTDGTATSDTEMGNATTLETVKVAIKITATQIDDYNAPEAPLP